MKHWGCELILIAAYPKSGNTWVRALLSTYFSDDQTLDIHNIGGRTALVDRASFDEHMGVTSTDLPDQIVLKLRQQYCIALQETEPANAFYKVHDAFTSTQDGQPIFPSEAVKGVVYLVRNPLNIAPSYAQHQNWTIDAIVEFMCDPNAALYYQNHYSFSQLTQVLGTWSDHVTSWDQQDALPTRVVRYEDLCEQPEQVLTNILSMFDGEIDHTKILNAIDTCSFARLKAQETKRGFPERNPHVDTFFQKGAARDWRAELTPQQIETLRQSFGPTMERYGYG